MEGLAQEGFLLTYKKTFRKTPHKGNSLKGKKMIILEKKKNYTTKDKSFRLFYVTNTCYYFCKKKTQLFFYGPSVIQHL